MSLASVLDACLADIQTGVATLEECLARHPEHADELRPLLEVALFLDDVEAPQPTAAFRNELRKTLMAQPAPSPAPLATRVRARAAVWARQLALSWAPRGLAGAAVLLVLTVMLTTSTFAAGILPSAPLYPVKRVGEQVRLAITIDALSRAHLHSEFAKLRRREADAMFERGDNGRAEALLAEAAIEEAKAEQLQLGLTIEITNPTPAPPTAVPTDPPTQSPPPTSTRGVPGVAPTTALPRSAPTVANAAPSSKGQDTLSPTATPTRSASNFQAPVSLPTATTLPTARPTVVLVVPTAVPTLAPVAYPSPAPVVAPPEEPAPPTETPEIRPPQRPIAPMPSRTPTAQSGVSGPSNSASPTPAPTNTPPIQITARTPVSFPTRTPAPAAPTAAPAAPTEAPAAPTATAVSASLNQFIPSPTPDSQSNTLPLSTARPPAKP